MQYNEPDFEEACGIACFGVISFASTLFNCNGFMMNRYLIYTIVLAMGCKHVTLPVEPGISKPLADWRSEHISDVSYQLRFNIPEEKSQPIDGRMRASFLLSDTTQNLQFDFKGPGAAVSQVSANGEPVPFAMNNDHVVVDSRYLHKGENNVEMMFTASDQSVNRNDDYLYTLFVPDRASTAFPCFDQPNLKARFELQLQVPSAWKAVANGPEEKAEEKGGKTLHYFTQTELLPTYLFAFVAGNFETESREHNQRHYTLYHRETNPEKLEENLGDIFRLLFLSIDRIEAYTGIPYPFQKYDFVAVPSFQYGGMEHPGVTLYRAPGLFLEGKPTPKQLLDRANLIAHETAHMWFGDLVTMPWFNEVWLKEVYANFIADKVTSPLFPEFNQDLLFLMAHHSSAYAVDRSAGANAITQPLDNLKDAGTLYGAIIYHKAPVVMDMLERRIGEEELQKALQQYLKNYSYGNAGWNELIGLLDTDGSLKNWSNVWVEEAGRPHIKATIDPAAVVIDELDPAGKNRIWQQGLDLVWPQGDGLAFHHVELSRPRTRLVSVLPDEGVDWLYLNATGKAYGFVEMDEAAQQFFAERISTLPDDVLRAAAWIDLRENMIEGMLNPSVFIEAVMHNLPQECDRVLYERLLGYLGECYHYYLSKEEQSRLQLNLEKLIGLQLQERPEQAHALSDAAMALFRSPAGLEKLSRAWDQQHLAGNPLTETQQTRLAFVLALHFPETADSILDEQETRLDNPDLKARFQFIRPSVSADEAVRDRFFESFQQLENREHEPWVLSALSYLNDPDFSEGREKYIEPGLALLPELQKTGDIFFPAGWVNSLLRGHKSAEAAAKVRRFLADHPDFPEPLRLKLLQSADGLLRKHPEAN